MVSIACLASSAGQRPYWAITTPPALVTRKASELMVAIRHRPEIALTHLDLAELLEHLDFAIGELRDIKMQPSLERALSRREILKA
jgi:hypothetical protein